MKLLQLAQQLTHADVLWIFFENDFHQLALIALGKQQQGERTFPKKEPRKSAGKR